MIEIADPYERGFIDGMQEQMKRSVDRAVNAMAQYSDIVSDGGLDPRNQFDNHPQPKPWLGLNWDDLPEIYVGDKAFMHGAKWAEAKLKEKNT